MVEERCVDLVDGGILGQKIDVFDEEGELMDGRHRLMKAMLNGERSIKVVRFDENPAPDRVDDA